MIKERAVKTVNYSHLFPTRYSLELESLKGTVAAETFKEPSQRENARKNIKKLLEERYQSGKNKWFFQALRVSDPIITLVLSHELCFFPSSDFFIVLLLGDKTKPHVPYMSLMTAVCIYCRTCSLIGSYYEGKQTFDHTTKGEIEMDENWTIPSTSHKERAKECQFRLLRRLTSLYAMQNNYLTEHLRLLEIKLIKPVIGEVYPDNVPVIMSTSSFVMAAWRPRLYCIVRVLIMSFAFFDALSMAFRLLAHMRYCGWS